MYNVICTAYMYPRPIVHQVIKSIADNSVHSRGFRLFDVYFSEFFLFHSDMSDRCDILLKT